MYTLCTLNYFVLSVQNTKYFSNILKNVFKKMFNFFLELSLKPPLSKCRCPPLIQIKENSISDEYYAITLVQLILNLNKRIIVMVTWSRYYPILAAVQKKKR